MNKRFPSCSCNCCRMELWQTESLCVCVCIYLCYVYLYLYVYAQWAKVLISVLLKPSIGCLHRCASAASAVVDCFLSLLCLLLTSTLSAFRVALSTCNSELIVIPCKQSQWGMIEFYGSGSDLFVVLFLISKNKLLCLPNHKSFAFLNLM